MDQTTKAPNSGFWETVPLMEFFPRLLSAKLPSEAATFCPKGHSSCHSALSSQLPVTCSALRNQKDVTHTVIYASSNP